MKTAKPILQLHQVSVAYPGKSGWHTVVDGVDLALQSGEILALLGPSGSGKSSLLRAVAGLEPVQTGIISWAGQDLAGVAVHRRGFGLMFQDGQLFSHRNVAGNIAYGLRGVLPRDRWPARVAEMLELVGLPGFADRAIGTLSGGQAQRVALARALAPRPQLLLLDEPLSALDRALRDHLVGVLREILHQTGTTALYVTHDHDEAFTIADRVGILAAGRLLRADTPTELWRDPGSVEIAEFLGYHPIMSRETLQQWGVPLPGDDAATRVALAPGAFQVASTPSDFNTGMIEVTAQTKVRAVRSRRGFWEVQVALPAFPQPIWAVNPTVEDDIRDENVCLLLDPKKCVGVTPSAER